VARMFNTFEPKFNTSELAYHDVAQRLLLGQETFSVSIGDNLS